MKEVDVKKLFAIAMDQVVDLEEELKNLAQVMQNNYELKLFFENPLVPREGKKAVLGKIFPGASPLFRSLIGLLIEEGLERSVEELARQLALLITQRLQTTFVDVRSAFPLLNEERDNISRLVGGKCYLRIKIDPQLIAGFQFMTSDGRFFDASLKNNLNKMRKELLNA